MADEKGLFLLVHPKGSKYWRFKYSILGKEKLLAFGVYPEVPLAEARIRCDEARKHLANGVDRSLLKKAAKQAAITASENSFQMKMRQPHLVTLAKQAVLILQELRPLTGASQYVFPCVGTNV